MATNTEIINNLLESLNNLSAYYKAVNLASLNTDERQKILNDIGTIHLKLESIIGTQDSLSASEIEQLRLDYQNLIDNFPTSASSESEYLNLLELSLQLANITTEQYINKSVDLSSLQSIASDIDENTLELNKSWLNVKLSGSSKVAIVGDSVTHGAYATNIVKQSWANKLKYNLLGTFSASNNFGNETTSQDNGDWRSSLFHEITLNVGSWTSSPSDDIWGQTGYERFGTTGSEMTATVKVIGSQKWVKCYHLNTPNEAGEYEIYINGVLKLTQSVNSSSVKSNGLSGGVKLSDKGDGTCDVKVKITSSTVAVYGFEYSENPDDLIVNIFAQGGRKTKDINEYVINYLCSYNDVIFWAMGHNDSGTTDIAETYQTLEWLRNYANSKGVFVVFCDFMWGQDNTHPIRVKMKEISSQITTGSIYLDIPERLLQARGVPTADYLINTIKQWDDQSHPNDKGHANVYSQVKSMLKL